MSEQYSHNSNNGKPPFPVFVSTAVVIFFLTLSAASSVGFVPYYIDGTEPTRSVAVEPVIEEGGVIALAESDVSLADLPELGDPLSTATKLKDIPVAPPKPVSPTRLVIDSINLDLAIQNTESRNLATLDKALEKGPVRYVDSAALNVPGNMLVFAHSSHLPIVKNPMFKAFNRLPELVSGDIISVYGEDGRQYLYAVSSVRKTDATDTVIDLSPTQGTKLTLSTCDTLTSKTSRFVVVADFIGTADGQ